ncbi:hypothetical protein OG263_00730 [Streptomyces canus]|nr:hypothetical protein [Streptomyces canus]MCX4852355.1 hypothetical protein [Streptomyces canus]
MKYITRQKTAVEAGSTGNKGIIGWYVPPWPAKADPDITDWKNLNKYAADGRPRPHPHRVQRREGR